jgi:hypothetical protein
MWLFGRPPIGNLHWMRAAMLNAITASIRRASFVVLAVVLASACAGSTPTAPAPIMQSSVVPSSPPVQPTFPPLSGPSRTFTFDHAPSPRVASYTTQSQFVLYDNGAFALQYPSLNGGVYRGGYTESNGVITFSWEGWSAAGPWSATGTIKDGLLTVQYNVIMALTDFEDAVYRLVQ